MQAIEMARRIMTAQKSEFEKLSEQLSNLPISLTPIRMFDILCWTTEKWDIRGNPHAPHGTAHESLLKASKAEAPTSQFTTKAAKRGKYVVFEDLERATGPKVHHVDCFYYTRWISNPTSTTTWHGPYESEEKAWKVCKEIASRSGFQPSKHRCMEK